MLRCTAGTVINTSAPIVIDNPVTVDGRGVTIEGDGRHRIFDIEASGVELLNFTMQRGDQAIRVSSGTTLTLTDSTVRDNTSSFSNGGAIFNDGVLTLLGTTVEDNLVELGSGGGIYNTGTLTLTNSKVLRNESARGSGGGIQNDQGGKVVIEGSEISENHAMADGGGISHVGVSSGDGTADLTVTNSVIKTNTSEQNGGGISSENGTVEVIDTMIQNNVAFEHGGGLSTTGESAMMSLTDSDVSGNKVVENARNKHGGGVYLSFGKLEATRTTWSENVSAVDAGAILVEGPTAELTLRQSTIYENRAANIGGGIRVYMGIARIINSTIFRNVADVDGGAVHLGYPSTNARVELRNSTISNNDVVGIAGEPVTRASAAISHVGGEVSFTQTLIDDTCCCGPASAPASITQSLDHNIESPDDTCQLNGPNDLVNVTPQALGLEETLAENGGPTPTLMPSLQSVAVDYRISNCAEPVDQRGISRPQNFECDIGAVEVD